MILTVKNLKETNNKIKNLLLNKNFNVTEKNSLYGNKNYTNQKLKLVDFWTDKFNIVGGIEFKLLNNFISYKIVTGNEIYFCKNKIEIKGCFDCYNLHLILEIINN